MYRFISQLCFAKPRGGVIGKSSINSLNSGWWHFTFWSEWMVTVTHFLLGRDIHFYIFLGEWNITNWRNIILFSWYYHHYIYIYHLYFHMVYIYIIDGRYGIVLIIYIYIPYLPSIKYIYIYYFLVMEKKSLESQLTLQW